MEPSVESFQDRAKQRGVPWQEIARNVEAAHQRFIQEGTSKSVEETSKLLGFSHRSAVFKYLKIVRYLHMQEVISAASLNKAMTVVEKFRRRETKKQLRKGGL